MGSAFFVGLMSGTSLDGIDAVLTHAGDGGDDPAAWRSLGFVHVDFPPTLRAELLALNTPGGTDELHRAALAAQALSDLYATATQALLAATGCGAAAVRAVGAHGQTVRHRPGHGDGGYTLQLLDGARLAELVGIDVVCDFRSRDVAAGGQGAPLVPAFHAALFARRRRDVAVLNLGGIANLTLLAADGSVGGHDCGPGNVLLDTWCLRHRGEPYDADGAWAATGRVDATLLDRCLAEPYFAQPPPKSTGRDLFNAAWIDARAAGTDPADAMATLVELTAVVAARDAQRALPALRDVHVCGGGARNGHLMSRLGAHFGVDVAVRDTTAAGVEPEHVEALAFAWLAERHLRGETGNVPAVTGARGARVLGACYPAGRASAAAPTAEAFATVRR